MGGPIPLTKIAKHIGYSRQHLYNLFEQKIIDLNLILIIGEFIHHDFSENIHRLKKYKKLYFAEFQEANVTNETSFEAKYYSLLQEHSKLLKQFNNLLNKKK